ncbi:MAG: 3-phosphoshikimate 1-carboxyvinyltransferase [Flavobacteriaceae bacterium]|nr:3-phosphoshikimate 1-carboxyvinyltransferase [Flavobacteriaceae bacterium]
MQYATVFHPTRKLKGTIHLPPSKSISNRLLVLQHLYKGIAIENLSQSSDTLVLQAALAQISQRNEAELCTIDVADCGTAMRFLAAVLAITPGQFLLTGTERMQQRPIAPLVDALRQLGADIEYTKNEGFPPLLIRGKKLEGGKVSIDGSLSSQYASALMMIGPALPKGLGLQLEGLVTSLPYIQMTEKLMQQCGLDITFDANLNNFTIFTKFVIPNSQFVIAPDWSSASYWYCMAALSEDAEIYLPGLRLDSLQGDAVCAKIFAKLGVETTQSEKGIAIIKSPGFDFAQPDINGSPNYQITKSPNQPFSHSFQACPDLVPAVAVACFGLDIPAELHGIGNIKHKESDRGKAIAEELGKLEVGSWNLEDNSLKYIPKNELNTPHSPLPALLLQTHSDHRLAMAFAALGILFPVEVENPNVVEKSYPNFWEDVKRMGFDTSTT